MTGKYFQSMWIIYCVTMDQTEPPVTQTRSQGQRLAGSVNRQQYADKHTINTQYKPIKIQQQNMSTKARLFARW